MNYERRMMNIPIGRADATGGGAAYAIGHRDARHAAAEIAAEADAEIAELKRQLWDAELRAAGLELERDPIAQARALALGAQLAEVTS